MTELKFTNETTAEVKAMAEAYLEKADNAELAQDKADNESAIEQCINRYKFLSKTACYAEAKASGDPLKYAVTQFYYPTIKLKATADKDSGIIIRSIIDTQAPIDLGDMHKKLGGIGHDTNWIYTAETFNYHLTIRAAERVGATVNIGKYALNRASFKRDLGKDPCSNTQMLKTLKIVISEMIGEEFAGKVTSHDVNYLVDVYANDSKKSKTAITAANHKTLRSYLKKVCYRILNGNKGYDVETREIKEK